MAWTKRMGHFSISAGAMLAVWVVALAEIGGPAPMFLLLLAAALWLVPGWFQCTSTREPRSGWTGWTTYAVCYGIASIAVPMFLIVLGHRCAPGTGCDPVIDKAGGWLFLTAMVNPCMVAIGAAAATASASA